MSVVDEVRQALQDVIAPELRELKGEVQAIRELMELRFDALNQRLVDLKERLEMDKRLAILEREREERRAS